MSHPVPLPMPLLNKVSVIAIHSRVSIIFWVGWADNLLFLGHRSLDEKDQVEEVSYIFGPNLDDGEPSLKPKLDVII